MKRYDFTKATEWLECYPVNVMADELKCNALSLVDLGLGKESLTDPKETVLKMQEAVNFVCGFLETIKEVQQ